MHILCAETRYSPFELHRILRSIAEFVAGADQRLEILRSLQIHHRMDLQHAEVDSREVDAEPGIVETVAGWFARAVGSVANQKSCTSHVDLGNSWTVGPERERAVVAAAVGAAAAAVVVGAVAVADIAIHTSVEALVAMQCIHVQVERHV